MKHRYKRVDYAASPAPGGRVRLQVRSTGRRLVLLDAVEAILSRCRLFRTLDGHAAQIRRELRLGPAFDAELRRGLRRLAADGLLVSEVALLGHVDRFLRSPRVPAAAPPPIDLVGVLTADRPPSVQAALDGYAGNARRHGREVELVIVDDSRTPHARESNRAFARAARAYPTSYLGLPEREGLARALSRRSGVDPALLRFALLPSRGHAITTGAARNCYLVLAAGRRGMLADDDTAAATAPHPAAAHDVLALSSAIEPTAFHFDSWPRLRRLVDHEADILGLHERLLGRSVAACLSDPRFSRHRFDELGTAFPSRLDGAVMRATALGVVGDPGIGSPASLLLWASAATRRRLLSSPEVYDSVFGGGRLLRTAACPTIAHTRFWMAGNMAIDARGIVPPFFPVQRNQDGVFGTLMWHVGACVGLVPHGILHLKADGPRRAMLPGRSLLHSTHHLMRLIASAPAAPGASEERRLMAVGRHLAGIAEAGDGELEEQLAPAARQALARALASTRQLLGESPHVKIGPYRHHLEEVRRELDTLLAAPRVSVSDLAGFPRPMGELRRLVGRFGALLASWPAIMSAAADVPDRRRAASPRRSAPR